jgi:hypothetical protein
MEPVGLVRLDEIAAPSTQCLAYLTSVIDAAEHFLPSRCKCVYACYWMHGRLT